MYLHSSFAFPTSNTKNVYEEDEKKKNWYYKKCSIYFWP